MITKYLTRQQNGVLMLVIMCTFLVLLRVQITQSLLFTFMLWNIFLALIPFFITEYAVKRDIENKSKVKQIVLFVIWLFFLPNAPYIITDFIHLDTSRNNPLGWFDLLFLFCSAITGLMITMLTLKDVYQIIVKKWSLKIADVFIPIVCFLSGFGIYLGRFLRFNSWDIVTAPISLVEKTVYSFKLPRAWYVTIGFGMFLWIFFYTFLSFFKTKRES
ncbi:DUF1361 domain-containing protein [uncultured Tenacibaculum sp.]|uniref:DUF1361 domain-containing protein n=1 Tax=uncultured Tenacibaculum sp. TaxID=174713 RepID=UPI00262A7772|nr:DUF1361 domain-containing protein [uncultured Tenacibaculum sp.]